MQQSLVELKRESGSTMELQALRYAAMVSTMRFDQAVEAHRKYLNSIGVHHDSEQALREFLELEDGPGALSETVRIVLAASDFPKDLATSVLWLNKQGLDIRCVQMRPHLLDQRVLLDIHQVIPLPSAEKYQVAVREKSMEQASAKANEKDYTRHDLIVEGVTLSNLPKRRLVYEIVAEAFRRNITPEQIAAAIPWREASLFISAPGQLNEQTFSATVLDKPLDRYFASDNGLFHLEGRTVALTNQWGARTLEAADNILSLLPEDALIEYSSRTSVVDEVTYEDYTVKKRLDGAIEVERGGVVVRPAKRALRDFAGKLNIETRNASGRPLNTRQLGAGVMRAIYALQAFDVDLTRRP